MPPSWIEILPWFTCNCSCIVCTGSKLPRTPGMSPAEVDHWLAEGRRRGIEGAWFGGGEPTLRPDLIPLLGRARTHGYRRIRVQTNGIRFAYPAFVRGCLDAGTTEASVSVKGLDARAHDAITRVRGSFARMTAGIRALVAAGLPVEADVLITTRSARHLPRIVDRFAALGVREFLFRVFSRHGLPDDELRELVPDFRTVAPHLQAAFDEAEAHGVAATSLHTPRCVLEEPYRGRCRNAADWNVLVVPPGGPPFPAEQSPTEGGAFLPGCVRCTLRKRCLGPRADYLEIHGGTAFVPVPGKGRATRPSGPGGGKSGGAHRRRGRSNR